MDKHIICNCKFIGKCRLGSMTSVIVSVDLYCQKLREGMFGPIEEPLCLCHVCVSLIATAYYHFCTYRIDTSLSFFYLLSLFILSFHICTYIVTYVLFKPSPSTTCIKCQLYSIERYSLLIYIY